MEYYEFLEFSGIEYKIEDYEGFEFDIDILNRRELIEKLEKKILEEESNPQDEIDENRIFKLNEDIEALEYMYVYFDENGYMRLSNLTYFNYFLDIKLNDSKKVKTINVFELNDYKTL